MTSLMLPNNDDIVVRVESVLTLSAEAQEEWLRVAGSALGTWDKIREMTTIKEAELLFAVNARWPLGEDEEDEDRRARFSRDAVTQWDEDFFVWAKAFTKRRSREPSSVTIANKVSVYRDWVGERRILYPDLIPVPKRDSRGEVIDPNYSEEGWDEIEFDPREVDYGKLLVARGAARREEMSPEAWTALADPYATVEELKRALQKVPSRTNRDDLRIWNDQGLLYASQGDVTVVFAALNLDNLDNPIAQRAMRRMLKVWGLDLPDDMIEVDWDRDVPPFDCRNGGLVINKGGERFIEISETAVLLDLSNAIDTILSERGVTVSIIE